MDFVTHLQMASNDAVLGIADKFSKALRLISGKSTWSATEWADAVFETVPAALENLNPFEIEMHVYPTLCSLQSLPKANAPKKPKK